MADDALLSTPDVTRGVVTSELQQRLLRALLAEWVHTMIPARVQRFDAGLQQVDAQPLVKDFHRDETGALVTGSIPIVTNVPVMFLTAGGFTFTVPIQAGASGTTGALIFSERSLDRWLAGSGQEVGPDLYSRFNLSDAVFIPGLLPFGAPMSVAPPTDHATAGSIGGARIHFRDGTITIGDESGAQFVALANKVLDELNKIQTAHNNHTHVVTATVAAANGVVPAPVTSAPTVTTYTPAAVAATQAKAK